MKRISLFCLWFGFVGGVYAQQDNHKPQGSPSSPTTGSVAPSLPSGPLLKSAPDQTSWLVVTIRKPAAGSSPAPASGANNSADQRSGAATKAARTFGGQKIGSVVYVWNTTDSGKEEHWGDGKTMVTTNAAWKVPLFSSGTPEEFPKPTWISRKNIKEIKKQGDKEYWVFRDRIFPGGENVTKEMLLPGENPEDLKVDATAVIDAETRLPTGVQVGEEVTTYKFEPLPAGATLSLPPELSALIAKRQQQIESAVRKPVRP